jgi:sulfate permease, SulP family
MQVPHRLYLTLFHGDTINYRAVLLSVTAIVVAVGLRRLVTRFGWPQIDLLSVLVIAGLIAYAAGWSIAGADGKSAVSVAAKVPQSLPTPHIPIVDVDSLGQLSQGALAIAFIGLIEALSIAKAIAYQSQQKIDYNARSWQRALPT